MLTEFSATHLPLVEQEMIQFLEEHTNHPKLKESMFYSIKAGGKRIRPLLLLAAAASFGETLTDAAYQTAAALEMIHTYSLIHDDLPAMDNDDLRRGKPTNHKVFGDAQAILAGDGLLTAAFQLITMAHLDSDQKLLLLQQLAFASGTEGMVAGQSADIESEHKQLVLEELAAIHERKTGRLIEFALLAGGVLANQPEEVVLILRNLASHLGLAFQIKDDLLDVTSTTQEQGKRTGKDETKGKNTYPKLLGLEEAFTALDQEIEAANGLIELLEQNVSSFDGTLLKETTKLFEIKK